jgi:hypothetical protein
MAIEATPRELVARRPFPARLGLQGNLIYKLITTADHKLIGIIYYIRPVLIRDWSPKMDGIVGIIWASQTTSSAWPLRQPRT